MSRRSAGLKTQLLHGVGFAHAYLSTAVYADVADRREVRTAVIVVDEREEAGGVPNRRAVEDQVLKRGHSSG